MGVGRQRMNSETDSGGRRGRETSHLSYDSARIYSQALLEPPGPPTLVCLPPDSEQVSSWCLASTSKPTEGKEVGHRETHIHPTQQPLNDEWTNPLLVFYFIAGSPLVWSLQRRLHWLSPNRAPSFTLCPSHCLLSLPSADGDLTLRHKPICVAVCLPT